jgi:hypothetical protein
MMDPSALRKRMPSEKLVSGGFLDTFFAMVSWS